MNGQFEGILYMYARLLDRLCAAPDWEEFLGYDELALGKRDASVPESAAPTLFL